MKTRHYVTMGILMAVAACIYWSSRPDEGATDGRVAVRGEVTVNGQPLKSGRIQFTPDRNTDTPAVPGRIENGSFHIRAADGLLPGTYMVTITLSRASKEEITRLLNSKSRVGQPAHKDDARSTVLAANGKSFDWPDPQVVSSGVDEVVLNFALPAPNLTQR
jgi:hypothetical protein